VSDREGRVFSDEELRILEMFAAQAAVALENARLFAETRRKTQRLEVLHRLALGLTATLGRQEVFTRVASAALELFGDVGCSLWLLEQETDELTLVADVGIRFPALRKNRAMKVGQGLMGTVVAERRAIILEDIQERGHNQALSQAEGFRAAMAVPLLFGDRCYGGLSVRRRSPEPFRPEDVDLLTALAGHAAITIEQARLYEDITTTNAHLQAHAAALQDKNAELDSFAYAVSHDLKAPLMSLQGMAGLLTEDCAQELGEEGRHYVARIVATVGQMETLIADVLMLARIGREGRPVAVVSLDEVVDLVLQRQAEGLRARAVKVTRGDLGSVRAIPVQMEQIFSNLIGNAIKYLGDTPTPRIEIGRTDAGEYYVRDNGIGIDPAYHAKIFQAFQRLKDVEVEGSGVGLAIVKKIVESGGGELRVESAVGQGSTFYVTWPQES
jgi:signal transduction histidine kinase